MSEHPAASDSGDRELKKVLDQFYKEIAVPKFDEPLTRLHLEVREILRGVERKDGRFTGEVSNVGSNASGMSALASSEFDILLLLNIEGTFEEYKLSPGLAKFRLAASNSALWEDASVGGYLQPRKLTDIFHKHVREVVTSMGGELTVGGEGGAAVTVSSTFQTFIKYKADLVVAVKCQGWPSSANASWLQPGYSKEWPKQETIATMKQNGYELVARNIYKRRPGIAEEDTYFLWTISMSRAETLLLQCIDEGSLCHKKCLLIMKALLLHFTVFVIQQKPIYLEQDSAITSYHLKTMLFFESQTYPKASQWNEDKLPERFRFFVTAFHRRMSEKMLPNFFFPGINLYQGYEGMNGLFLKLMSNPIGHIRSIKFDEQLQSVGHNEEFLYAIK